MAAAIGAAVHAAPCRQRRVGHGHDNGVAVLVELAHDHRAEIVQRGLRPVDRRQTVARLPVAQADEVETGALEDARVIADRVLLHPFDDEELDLGDLAQVDERLFAGAAPSRHRHALHHVLDDRSTVTPWLAA